ncbi:DUF4340 domain-containing protein [candidate division KSB1 bacterium]
MKFKGTIWIGAVFVLLALSVYLYDKVWEPYRKKVEEEKNRFYVFEVSDIVRAEINRPDTTFVFVKNGDDWLIESPVSFDGDDSNIEGLIVSLKYADKIEKVADDTEAFSRFGLDSEAAEITLTSESGTEYKIVAGDLNPFGNLSFAKLPESDDIYTTIGGLNIQAYASFYDYRDKSILSFDTADINSVNFFKNGRRLTVKTDEYGIWNVDYPRNEPGDKFFIDRLIKRIIETPIQKFINDSPGQLNRYGISERNSVQVELKDGSTKSLFFGDREGDIYYASDSDKDIVYAIDTSSVNLLTPELFKIRSKAISEFDKLILDNNQIDRMDILYPTESYKFTREQSTNKWYMTFPLYKLADREQIISIIRDIYYVRAAKYIDENGKNLKSYGLDPPAADITLYSNDEVIVHIQLGGAVGENRYYYNLSNDKLAEVRSYIFSRLVLPQDRLILEKE